MNPPLEQLELTTGLEPKGTVIWMHGLGADGWDRHNADPRPPISNDCTEEKGSIAISKLEIPRNQRP